jgi:CubicO group peptidase (beta-lactamase class C family)
MTSTSTAIADRMKRSVRQRGVGGAAWAVAVGDVVHEGSAGWLDPGERRRPMRDDAIFRIASVTKPIAAVAALQLVDEGLIALDDPIDDVLPELAGRRVLVDPDGPVDGPTVTAARSLTLRDLLTFRCGYGMDFAAEEQPLLHRLWELGIGPGPKGPECTADEFLARFTSLPLADQPGTHWRYHVGSDIAGVFVERVRGASLEAVLRDRVFEPLGMSDTGFAVSAAQRERFGQCRMVDDTGELAVWDEPTGMWATPPAMCGAAAGLVSTTADLVAFGRMLAARGAAPAGRVLSPELVAEMTTDQLTDDQRAGAGIKDGAMGWGLGIGTYHRGGASSWPPVGAYGWDGGLGSQWTVDAHRRVVAVLLTTDAFSSPEPPAVMADFDAVVADAVGA